VERAFLIIGALSGFVGVAFGAFGSHALRARLTPERLVQFETGVRYQVWHSLALFAAAFVHGVVHPWGWYAGPIAPLVLIQRSPAAVIAGWLFIAGIALFSGSLYALALTANQRWGVVTPFGGGCFLLGWLALAWAALAI
jgi:uncharacterized membrane protein YgdD (TMEM256/DUF423 family)